MQVTVKRLKRDFLEKSSNKLIDLNDSVEVFNDLGLDIKTVEDLKTKSAEGWVKSFLDKSLEKLKKQLTGIFNSKTTIGQYEKEYKSIENQTIQEAETIRNFLVSYPDTIKYDSRTKEFIFVPEKIDAMADKQATFIFSEEQEQYYNLITNLCNDLKTIKEFEKENDFVRYHFLNDDAAFILGDNRYNDSFTFSLDSFYLKIGLGQMCMTNQQLAKNVQYAKSLVKG